MPVSVQCSQCGAPAGSLPRHSDVARRVLRRDPRHVRVEDRQVFGKDQRRVAHALRAHLLQRHADVALRRLVHEGPPALRPHPNDELGLRVHYRPVARLARRQRPGLGPRLGNVALDRHEVCGGPTSSRSGAIVVSCSIRWPSRWRLMIVPCQRRPASSSRRIAAKNSGGCSRSRRFAAAAPQRLGGAVAGRGLEGVVDVGEPVVGAGDLHRVARLLDRERQQAQLGVASPLFGDVRDEQHPAAVLHHVLAHPHPAPVGDTDGVLATLPLAHGQALPQEVLAHVRVIDRPARDPLAHPVLEALAERQPLAQRRGHHLRIAAVVEDYPVVRGRRPRARPAVPPPPPPVAPPRRAAAGRSRPPSRATFHAASDRDGENRARRERRRQPRLRPACNRPMRRLRRHRGDAAAESRIVRPSLAALSTGIAPPVPAPGSSRPGACGICGRPGPAGQAPHLALTLASGCFSGLPRRRGFVSIVAGRAGRLGGAHGAYRRRRR